MTRSTQRSAWKTLAAVTALCATPALAACGSDDDNASGDAKASGGDTIKVLVYGPIDAKGFSIPGIRTGAQAGIDKVNAEGGINGRKLEMVLCNDNNDPNTAAGCARQAVSEGVAFATGLSIMEASIVPALEKSGIPVVGNLPVADFVSANQYPYVGGGAGTQMGVAKYLAERPECADGVAVVQEELVATDAQIPLIELALQASGNRLSGVGKAPQGAPDFAPAIEAAAGQSPCALELVTPTAAAQVVSGVNANPKIKVAGSNDSQVPGQIIAALGSAADGLIVTNEYLPLNDSSDAPAVKEFLELGRAIDADFDPEGSAASAYLAPQVVKAAIEAAGVDEVTPETVTAALDELAGFDTGMGPVVDFTVKNPTKAFTRLPAVAKLYVWVAKDGLYVLESPDPIDISPIYEAAAAAGQ